VERTEFKRRLTLLSVSPFLLLFFVASALSLQVYRQRSAGVLVDRADGAIARTTRIMERLVDMETGFRGYLLSGNLVFLEPYERSVGSVQTELRALREIEPAEARRVDQLEQATNSWLEYARSIIARRQSDPSFRPPFSDDEGKARMDRVRIQLDDVLQAEQSGRDLLRRRHARELRTTISAVYALSVLAAVLIALYSRRQASWIHESYHRSLERTRREGEQYRAIFDGVKDYGMALLDANGAIETWSHGAEKLTGYLSGEVVGKSIAILYEPSEGAQRVEDVLAQAAAHGRYETEGFRLRKDGAKYWADIVVTALHDTRGEVRGYSNIFRDYSRRRQLEEERAALLRRLEEGIRSRDDFLGLASHELRTPITALSLRLQHIERGGAATPEASVIPVTLSSFATLKRGLARLSRLVESMLDASQIHAGALPLDFAPADLSKLARQAVDDHSEQFAASGFPVEARIEEGISGKVDALRIEQVMVNLLVNALRHGRGPIEVTLGRNGTSARFAVKDSGPGIAAEHQERIFERYARLNGTTTHGGLGIGLFISRELIEAHGGTLRVESAHGTGSVFSFDLPLA
jgi:PAS domain S-box-containing protein